MSNPYLDDDEAPPLAPQVRPFPWVAVALLVAAMGCFLPSQNVGCTPIIPPGPNPVEPVVPVVPAPIEGGTYCAMIVYELDEVPSYPASQRNQMYSKSLRVWVASNLDKSADGTTEFRVLDKDTVDAEGQTSKWVKAMRQPRATLPWLLVSNGTTGYSGPLPATEAETIELIGRYK